ncbi:MAG TPA: cytochrome c biogenesis heme-transporting ATPase CcmA [Candidatus Polarisedimenticolia bacterium]|nr:cytochrome c biogenesis heme-transporting ATPase CcmA [Candidatus Polarisedimenticolia bacterium]
MTTHFLEIDELSCARGDRTLFEGLSARVARGELLYVAGSNGSGKTTLLRTICGLARPASGDIRWDGQSTHVLGDDYRRCLNYVGHHDGVQGELTPIENLRVYVCATRNPANHASAPAREVGAGTFEIEATLERLGLAPYRSFPAKILSQGQRRRLALARLLVTEKPLWILDEPFTALDVRSCQLISALLADHLARGGMAMISSHQVFDIPGTKPARVDLDTLRVRSAYLPAELNSVEPLSPGQRTA